MLKQTVASDCAITGVCCTIADAVLGALSSGLMISSMGVLSTDGGGPVHVDSDVNSSHTFNVSCVNSSNLRAAAFICTKWLFY